MPQIRPITDLRNTSEISDACHARREPVFITKNGYGDLVVMSIETYEEMLDCIATDKAIADAEQEIAAGGQLLDAKEALGALRRKYFGLVQRKALASRPPRFGRHLFVYCADAFRAGNGAEARRYHYGGNPLAGFHAAPLPGAENRRVCRKGLPSAPHQKLHRHLSH